MLKLLQYGWCVQRRSGAFLFLVFSPAFLRLFLYFSYTFPILFFCFKRKEKEKKRQEKGKKRQEKTRKAGELSPRPNCQLLITLVLALALALVFEIKDVYYSDAEEDITMDFERVAADDSMSDDGAEAASDDGDFDDEPPEPGDMQIALFRDFLDWKGLVLTEPTAQTHGAVELGEYEKQRQARMEANQDMLIQLGLA